MLRKTRRRHRRVFGDEELLNSLKGISGGEEGGAEGVEGKGAVLASGLKKRRNKLKIFPGEKLASRCLEKGRGEKVGVRANTQNEKKI